MQMVKLEAGFLAKGKGRPPKLLELEFTTRLVQQGLILKEKGNKTYDETEAFLKTRLFAEKKIWGTKICFNIRKSVI